jgi:hypothetical protein
MNKTCRGHEDTDVVTWPLFDARGIYVARVCNACEATVRASYRPEIFSDPSYEADEEIDPEPEVGPEY